MDSTSNKPQLSENAYAELERLRDELKDFEAKTGTEVISYSPLCPECLKKDIYSPGCFHEEEQAWVCCTKRKVHPGCGAIILTVAEYNKKRGKPEGGALFRAKP